MRVIIAGMGYVGLSNAVLLSQFHDVYAYDIVQARADMVNARKSPIIDKEIEEYIITVNDIDITVREYSVENYETYRRVAEFGYKGVHYQLKGIMEKEDFEKILKNLHFFG